MKKSSCLIALLTVALIGCGKSNTVSSNVSSSSAYSSALETNASFTDDFVRANGLLSGSWTGLGSGALPEIMNGSAVMPYNNHAKVMALYTGSVNGSNYHVYLKVSGMLDQGDAAYAYLDNDANTVNGYTLAGCSVLSQSKIQCSVDTNNSFFAQEITTENSPRNGSPIEPHNGGIIIGGGSSQVGIFNLSGGEFIIDVAVANSTITITPRNTDGVALSIPASSTQYQGYLPRVGFVLKAQSSSPALDQFIVK